MNHAILVAGHAVLRDPSRLEEDAGWYLLDFQKNEPKCYMGHIQAAVELAAINPESHLIFSGGPTRAEAGPRSEGLSYWLAAEAKSWWGHESVRHRAFVEDFARDSFENLLFGLCRAKEISGSYPDHVTMVSWEFKRERFAVLHRGAIGWPEHQFTYVGPNDPPHRDQALMSEVISRAKYLADPYSSSDEFRKKKQARNPFRRQHGYAISCPEMFTPDKPWVEESIAP